MKMLQRNALNAYMQFATSFSSHCKFFQEQKSVREMTGFNCKKICTLHSPNTSEIKCKDTSQCLR